MKELSIKNYTPLFIFFTGILVVVAFVSYNKISLYKKSVDAMMLSNEVKNNIFEVVSTLKDAEIGQRGYLLSQDSLFLQPFIGAEQHSNRIFARLDSLFRDNLPQQENSKKLKTLVDQRYMILSSNLILLKNFQHNSSSDSALTRGKTKMEEVRKQASLMLLSEDKLLVEHKLVKNRTAAITPIFLLVFSLSSILAIALFFFRLLKETRMRILSEDAEKQLEEKVKRRTAQLEERKNFLETILETSKELIVVYSNDFTLLSINKSAENLIGRREDVIGKNLFEIYPHALGSKAESDLRSAFSGNIVHNEAYQSSVTGRYIENYINPLKDRDGNVYAALAIANDVTNIILKQKEIEVANNLLQIQNQTFELAEKISKFGSYKWDKTTGVLDFSDNFFYLLGCTPHEFVPTFKKFLSFIHPDDLKQVIKDAEKTIQTGIWADSPYRIISKSGTIKYIRSSGKFSGQGPDRLLIGTVQDISDDIAASKELIAKNIELENINAELASFSYIASHDLQEPLRKIQGFSKRIMDKEAEYLSDTAKDYFNRIHAAAKRMQNLIESLLSFSHTNTAELVFVKTDLNKTLKEVKITLQEIIKAKNAVIETKQLPTLNAMPVQIHQLFLNLLSNSLKYSKDNVIPLIKISAEKVKINESAGEVNHNGSIWKIAISDNGIGFEQQYENKIFELFQRLHGKTEYEGTGIGLAICKKIVQAHNGTISATGQPGIGSTFTFFLPDNYNL